MALWGILWRSENKLDGKTERLRYRSGNSGWLVFETRQKARDAIEEHWGYLRTRPDLRAEPHGWKMPKAVKIKIAPIDDGEAG